jgi:hypothetical protein
MPAPPIFRDRIVATLTRLLPRMIDRMWDASEAAQRAMQREDPDPRKIDSEKERDRENSVLAIADAAGKRIVQSSKYHPRVRRLRQGEARRAVRKVIAMSPDEGIDREGIRRKVAPLLDGMPISENTLRRVLMDLRKDEEIYTKNSRWFPSDATEILATGTFRTIPRPPRDRPDDH